MDDRDSIPEMGENFSPHQRLQTGSGPAQSPIQWVPGAVSPG
jgi:hypothetical protein